MVFSSIPFLFYFLPLVIVAYYVTPKCARNAVLLIFSLIFCGWGGWISLALIIVSILQGFICGLAVEKTEGSIKSKLYMCSSVIISLAILAVFKYADFFIVNFNAVTGLHIRELKLILPIGISFFTFQMISYVIDVYRGECQAQKNIIDLALYIAMFPQLIAGPIVKYSDIEAQLHNCDITLDKAASGVTLFVTGLAKKVIIANQLGELVAHFTQAADNSVLFYWIYAIAFTLQMYFDFSGYSDMAVGLGRLFGFELCRNFNYPYIAGSITEFWRRWHISLGLWFRNYLYIPLGGNRVGRKRWLFNILIVWMATGLWHGAQWNFVVWGLLFACMLIVEKFALKKYLDKSHVLSHVYVMLVVIVGSVIFNSSNLTMVGSDIAAMLGFTGIPAVSHEAVYYLRSYKILLIIAAIGTTPLPYKLVSKLDRRAAVVLQPLYVIILLVISTAYLVDGSFNPFLYFRF